MCCSALFQACHVSRQIASIWCKVRPHFLFLKSCTLRLVAVCYSQDQWKRVSSVLGEPEKICFRCHISVNFCKISFLSNMACRNVAEQHHELWYYRHCSSACFHLEPATDCILLRYFAEGVTISLEMFTWKKSRWRRLQRACGGEFSALASQSSYMADSIAVLLATCQISERLQCCCGVIRTLILTLAFYFTGKLLLTVLRSSFKNVTLYDERS